MILLPSDADDGAILAAVRRFVDLLAEEKYPEAWSLIDPWPGYANWTPELIQTVVRNYGSPEPMADGRVFKVTPLNQAPPRPKSAHHAVERYHHQDRPGHVLFDVPLNGEWSDLTISFDLIRKDGGLVLRLEDIHVM
jgi:hypothetical protein